MSDADSKGRGSLSDISSSRGLLRQLAGKAAGYLGKATPEERGAVLRAAPGAVAEPGMSVDLGTVTLVPGSGTSGRGLSSTNAVPMADGVGPSLQTRLDRETAPRWFGLRETTLGRLATPGAAEPGEPAAFGVSKARSFDSSKSGWNAELAPFAQRVLPPAHPLSTTDAGGGSAQARARNEPADEASLLTAREIDFPAKNGRNQDRQLPAGLITATRKARTNAHKHDPVMLASGLAVIGPSKATNVPDGFAYWQAHHLISVAQVQDRKHRDIFNAAAKAGWHIDEKANLIGLPRDINAQVMLHNTGARDADRPLHNSGHQGPYKLAVERQIQQVRARLEGADLLEGSPEYNHYAKTLIEKAQVNLRRLVLSHRMDRLAEADHSKTTQEASAQNPWQQLANTRVATGSHAPGAQDAADRASWLLSAGVPPTKIASSEPTVTRATGRRLG